MAPQSLKINSDTYLVYLTIPDIEHHPLMRINQMHFVIDPTLRGGIGYLEERDFHLTYKYVREPSWVGLTAIERLPQEE